VNAPDVSVKGHANGKGASARAGSLFGFVTRTTASGADAPLDPLGWTRLVVVVGAVLPGVGETFAVLSDPRSNLLRAGRRPVVGS
jgi:hypothetical protein